MISFKIPHGIPEGNSFELEKMININNAAKKLAIYLIFFKPSISSAAWYLKFSLFFCFLSSATANFSGNHILFFPPATIIVAKFLQTLVPFSASFTACMTGFTLSSIESTYNISAIELLKIDPNAVFNSFASILVSTIISLLGCFLADKISIRKLLKH